MIDDDEITNFVNRAVLENSGVSGKIEVAETVRQALDILGSCKDVDKTPELIFLDLNMPGMTGWDFIEEYKKQKCEGRDNVIIILSASANPTDEERSKKYPEITAFRRKPLTNEMVSGIMKEFFGNGSRE